MLDMHRDENGSLSIGEFLERASKDRERLASFNDPIGAGHFVNDLIEGFDVGQFGSALLGAPRIACKICRTRDEIGHRIGDGVVPFEVVYPEIEFLESVLSGVRRS